MPDILTVSKLSKTYASGHRALDDIDLSIRRGEIFALLGPNGAGKTTLISVICGIVRATAGSVTVDGHDTVRDYTTILYPDRPAGSHPSVISQSKQKAGQGGSSNSNNIASSGSQ